MTVALYHIPGYRRSTNIARAWQSGIAKVEGRRVDILPASSYRTPTHEVAAFYGLTGPLGKAFADYRADPKRRVIFCDLGYIGRTEGGRINGYHRICVDARHPTGHLDARKHGRSRLDALGLRIAPWRSPSRLGHIVVAGMGAKGAAAEGYRPNEWEARAIATIQAHTKRRIVYRPKPNWYDAKPIAGVDFSKPGARSLEQDLAGAHCIVSHHSNANVEALALGVPGFTVEGVASKLSLSDLALIEKPIRPRDREQFFADLAFAQWRVAEIADGSAWVHLRNEGLIP